MDIHATSVHVFFKKKIQITYSNIRIQSLRTWKVIGCWRSYDIVVFEYCIGYSNVLFGYIQCIFECSYMYDSNRSTCIRIQHAYVSLCATRINTVCIAFEYVDQYHMYICMDSMYVWKFIIRFSRTMHTYMLTCVVSVTVSECFNDFG